MIFNLDIPSNININDYWNNNINNCCCIDNLEKNELNEELISKLKKQLIVIKNKNKNKTKIIYSNIINTEKANKKN